MQLQIWRYYLERIIISYLKPYSTWEYFELNRNFPNWKYLCGKNVNSINYSLQQFLILVIDTSLKFFVFTFLQEFYRMSRSSSVNCNFLFMLFYFWPTIIRNCKFYFHLYITTANQNVTQFFSRPCINAEFLRQGNLGFLLMHNLLGDNSIMWMHHTYYEKEPVYKLNLVSKLHNFIFLFKI